ncbi:MAG: GrpB family protein [Dehalococcoidales bacterium]|nr:GrpB family protein [Dehalococcoidales bacterium]
MKQNDTGLKRGIVQLAGHRAEWHAVFLTEAEKIKSCVGDIALQIEHVGSTSVPGLAAKPIIDIAIGVESSGDILPVAKRLTDAGYIDRGDQGKDGGYLVVKDAAPGVRILHIHIVEKKDIQWWHYLSFRDILRGNKKIRQEYARLKKDLAQKFPEDRYSYTSGKAEFIRHTLSGTQKSLNSDQD